MDQKIEQIDKMFRIIESCETKIQIIGVEKFILVAEFINEEERRNFLFYIDYKKRVIQDKEILDNVN